jgi:hypothetical protein
MKLVAYCRVSTDNQKEEGTIRLQEEELQEYCRAEGHELIAIYKDEGINPEQAAVVSLIHRMRRRKLSYHEIARRLNRQGLAAPGGDRWYARSVQYIAQNPIYRGKYSYKTESSVREDLRVRAQSQIALV